MVSRDPDGAVPRGQGRSRRSTGYRARSYYVADEWHFRLRNAWWATHTHEGAPETVSAAVNDAIAAAVRRLEETYNAGEPFPPMPEGKRPAGAGPTGRARQADAVRRQAEQRRRSSGS